MESDPVIDSDLYCVHCNYNLRTLSIFGRCPECGAFVSESNQRHSLAHADGRITRPIALGLYLQALAPILLLTLVVVEPEIWPMVLIDLLPGGAKCFVSIVLLDVPSPLAIPIAVAHLLAQCAGTWLIARDDSQFPVPRDAKVHRELCRVGVVIAGLLFGSAWWGDRPLLVMILAILFDLLHMFLVLGYIRSIGVTLRDNPTDHGLLTAMLAQMGSVFLIVLMMLVAAGGAWGAEAVFLLFRALNHLWSSVLAVYLLLRLANLLGRVPRREGGAQAGG